MYAITLGILGVGLFRTGGRTWGADAWAWVSPVTGAVLLAAGILAGVLAFRGPRLPGSARWLPALGWAAVAALAGAFWVWRTQAHFLGDGYQNLAVLAVDPVRVKATARGTLQLLILLRDAFGGGEQGALAAYRALAVGSGVAWIGIVLVAARREFPAGFERASFAAVLLLSGPVILFFGYVENYAPFVTVVTAYTLLGVRVAQTGRGRWAAPALVGAAIYLHVLGFALLPSLAWILLSGTALGRFFARLPARRRWAGLGGLALVAALFGVPAWRDSLTLQFALVPLPGSPYALEGYTLFSASHLLDLANLAFLLLPGGAVLIAAIAAAPRRRFLRGGPARFLAWLILSTSGAVFLLDPKLGMPRDWDVFAFAGIPWAVGLAWFWAHAVSERPALRPFGPLAAGLGLLVLVPRLLVLGDPHLAVHPFAAYLHLDQKKSRNSRLLLVNYYEENGRQDLADAEVDRWNQDYPERRFLVAGIEARNRGDIDESIRWNRLALAENPQYFDAYNNLADGLLLQSRPQEAEPLLRIALAINPGEVDVIANLGTALYMLGDPAGAKREWSRARALRPDGYYVNRNLARMAQGEGDRDTYEMLLGEAAVSPQAHADIVAEWGDILSGRGFDEQARQAYAEALRRGLAEPRRGELLARFPDLAPPPDSTQAP